MRAFVLASLLTFLSGCVSLNSPSTGNHSTTEMKKHCGCPGMRYCCRGEDGRQCCTPDECTCDQVTFKDKDCSCPPRPWPFVEEENHNCCK